jgi:hypothetical protein
MRPKPPPFVPPPMGILIFLPEVSLADKLDLDAGLGRRLLRVLPNPVAEWLGELRIVEYPDLPFVKK